MHIHTYMYMYTLIHVHTHVHIRTYMYTLIHTCTYTQPEGENEGGLPLTSLKIVDMFKDMIRCTNKAKRTALHLAAENGHDRYILYYTVHYACTVYYNVYTRSRTALRGTAHQLALCMRIIIIMICDTVRYGT